MYKNKFVSISILFVTSILFFVAGARAQDSEIDQIVKEVSVDTQKNAISNYTYLMEFAFERHKKFGGRKLSRLYEAILPSKFFAGKIYQHQMVLLRDSERIISDVEIMEARKSLAKELEKDENEADKQTSQTFEDGGYWVTFFTNSGKTVKVDVLKLLQNSKLGNLQRKKIDGRDVITIDFLPKPDIVPERGLSYLSKMEGQIFIDEADKRIVKVEGYVLGDFVNQKDKPDVERQKEMVFLFSQTKVAEGFWFPQTIRLNFGKHPEIFESIEIQFNFSEYKRANVDVKDAIETPKETPKDQATKTITATEEKKEIN